MGPVELMLLGRTLMKLGEQALPSTSGGERTVVIVMSDVYEHPGTTVGEVAARTGLPQSAVSGAVARLREAGSVLAEPDPADRRRQLLARNPNPTARQREVAAIDIAPTVAAALSTDEPAALTEVLTALETVARHLRPHR
ncbi:MarR family transcriptional regulator [Dactylosporangium sp. NPDC049742]|uniref:MarR family transcriptional regulator n=1 Tax=Dactylosporangium sp. NPDC049742 TaxID=3154737 RepID=UPI003438D282